MFARLEAKPDLTLRALLGELRERGIAVSYYAVWNIVHRAGKSFKKKSARRRTGSPGRGSQARVLAASSTQD